MFKVVYDDDGQTHVYCVYSMDLPKAEEMLKKFKARYLNPDGTGQRFPNGKGYFTVTNPRIVPV